MKKKRLVIVMMAVTLAFVAYSIPVVTVKAADVATGTVESQDTLSIKEMNTDKVSPQNVGNSIKVTAKTEASKGETVTHKYIIVRNSDSKIVYSKGYNSKNYILWTPEEAGDYTINCLAKDSQGNASKSSIKYQIVDKQLEIEKLESSADSCNVSENIKFNTIVNGEGTLTYKYLIFKRNELSYSTGFRKSSSINWIPSEEGTYTVYCKVKDSFGNEKMISKDVEVVKKAETNKVDTSKIDCNAKINDHSLLKGEYEITNKGIENLDLTKLKVKLYFKYDYDENDPLVTSIYYSGIKYSVEPYYEVYQNDVTAEVTKEGDYSCVTFSFNRAVDMPINSEVLYLQFAVNQTSWNKLSNLSDVHTVLEYED